MCGISCFLGFLCQDCEKVFLNVSSKFLPSKQQTVPDIIIRGLRSRGPDHIQSIQLSSEEEVNLLSERQGLLICSVLSMRNTPVVPQPIHNADFVLSWNGEMFGLDKTLHNSRNLSSPSLDESDTRWVEKHLEKIVLNHYSDVQKQHDQFLNFENSSSKSCFVDTGCHSQQKIRGQSHCLCEICAPHALAKDFVEFLECIQGPYAFVVFFPRYRMLCYGRDPMGRRSLLRRTVVVERQGAFGTKKLRYLLSISSIVPPFPSLESSTFDGVEVTEVSVNGMYYHILPHTGSQKNMPRDEALICSSCILENGKVRSLVSVQKDCVISYNDLTSENAKTVARRNSTSLSESLASNSSPDQQVDTENIDSTNWVIFNMNGVESEIKEYCVPWAQPPLRTHPLSDTAWEDAKLCEPVINNYDKSMNTSSPLHDVVSGSLKEYYFLSLQRAVRCRIQGAPQPIGILFSGGLDCMVLAALTALLLREENAKDVKLDSSTSVLPIELLNVAFTDFPEYTPDRISARDGYKELCQRFSPDEFTLICIDIPSSEVSDNQSQILSLIKPSSTVMDLNIATAIWFAARGKGIQVKSIDQLEDNKSNTTSTNSLFCGTVSGTNCHKLLCDSENSLKFECLCAILNHSNNRGLGQDEASGKFRLSELGKHYSIPYRQYGYAKLSRYLQDAQKEGICHLGYDQFGPFIAAGGRLKKDHEVSSSKEDFSSSRCDARMPFLSDTVIRKSSNSEHYTSTCRVLLCGSGADETLGGYARYRTAFHRNGYAGVRAELNKDCARLWKRNLGRDDRITSDWSRELRTPYLDENVLQCLFTHATSFADLCDFDLPPGQGDKKLLRGIAKDLGLDGASGRLKRAIQFGSRIANNKIKGTARLDTQANKLLA